MSNERNKSNLKHRYNYKDAGVDVFAGNSFIKNIAPLVKSTARSGTTSAIGGFGGHFDLKAAGYKDPILVAATDGVGTKLKIAIETKILHSVGIDLVAMCTNDLICQGAEPLFFLDYIATGKLDIAKSEEIISGIVAGCKTANTALIGGETAEMPGMYQANEFDLAGFAVGALNRGKELPKNIEEGDILIGLASSGIHSNGYSLIRKILDSSDMDFFSPSPFSEGSLGSSLLEPTKIYVQDVLKLLKCEMPKGIAHITGGGITENLPRILTHDLGAKIDLGSWPLPKVFRWLFNEFDLHQDECLKTFNCGLGMILVIAKEYKNEVLKILNEKHESAFYIGQITSSKNIQYTGNFK